MRIEMPGKPKTCDRELRVGAVRIIEMTAKPIAQVAHDLGVNEDTLGNRANQAREEARRAGVARPDGFGDRQLSLDPPCAVTW